MTGHAFSVIKLNRTPMKNLWSSTLLVVLLIVVSCSDKKQEEQIPNNAFPITYRGHLYVNGLADSIIGNYVFDTGASNFYYDSTYYAENDFHYTNFFTALLPGAGAKPQKVEVIKDTINFKFGKYLYRTNIVPILRLKPILGDFADGILGMEYFYKSVLEINYEKEYMRLFQTVDSVDVSSYSKIKLTKNDNRLFIPLKLRINDTLTIVGNYQLDFGSGGSVSLTSSTANKYKLFDNIEKKTRFFTKYGGVGGESSSYDFMAKSIQIGDFVFSHVTMDFSIDKSGAMASDEHLGLLGNEIYERFDLLIDFINNDLYLKPNTNYKDAFEFSKLGFSYVDRSQTLNAWIVTGLYSRCHAEKQGLKIDDKIIAVNGINVDQISYKSQKDFFKKLSNIVLTINRNDLIKDIKFKLEPIQ